MQVPILRQGRVLIASVQSSLSDCDLLELQSQLALMVGKESIVGVVIDVTVLDVIDSFSVRVLRSIGDVLRLRGAQLVIVGIQPDIATAMVRLGLGLEEFVTALDLEDGLAVLAARTQEGESRWKAARSSMKRSRAI